MYTMRALHVQLLYKNVRVARKNQLIILRAFQYTIYEDPFVNHVASLSTISKFYSSSNVSCSSDDQLEIPREACTYVLMSLEEH